MSDDSSKDTEPVPPPSDSEKLDQILSLVETLANNHLSTEARLTQLDIASLETNRGLGNISAELQSQRADLNQLGAAVREALQASKKVAGLAARMVELSTAVADYGKLITQLYDHAIGVDPSKPAATRKSFHELQAEEERRAESGDS